MPILPQGTTSAQNVYLLYLDVLNWVCLPDFIFPNLNKAFFFITDGLKLTSSDDVSLQPSVMKIKGVFVFLS